MFPLRSCPSCLLILWAAVPAFAQTDAATTVKFNRDVRPILTAACYRCHGPDAEHREADLRLDLADQALADRDGQPAIVPGELESSEVWHRISSDDPDYVMPPPDAKLDLSQEQIATVARWIRQGAKFEGHWAFITPRHPDVPKTVNSKSVRGPIDAFVQRKLKQVGLARHRRPTVARLFAERHSIYGDCPHRPSRFMRS